MNEVYYLIGGMSKDKTRFFTGGHGYKYDPNKESKKRIVKNVPTFYGYFVNADHQNQGCVIDEILSGRVNCNTTIGDCLVLHLDLLFKDHKENNKGKLLLATNMAKTLKSFINNTIKVENIELKDRVLDLYNELKEDIIIDYTLYPKGGFGVQHGHNQLALSELLSEYNNSETNAVLDKCSEKEFSEPNVELNPLVGASRWYFNTGDESEYYNLTDCGRRTYYFGAVEPDKGYYGKSTPDVYYGALFTKEPLNLLDRIFDFTKASKPNPLNILLAGNLNNISSKEVSRTINVIPGKFEGNEFKSPVKIATNDSPTLVDFISPAGMTYVIRDSLSELNEIYRMFQKRNEEGWFGKIKFIDITEHFFELTEKGTKLNPEFTQSVLKMIIPITSPDCPKPVKIGLSIKYDVPDRNSFNSLVKSKIKDVKVYMGLDFSNKAGVSYFTITQTPNFDYLMKNSVANLRVYSLRELGK